MNEVYGGVVIVPVVVIVTGCHGLAFGVHGVLGAGYHGLTGTGLVHGYETGGAASTGRTSSSSSGCVASSATFGLSVILAPFSLI